MQLAPLLFVAALSAAVAFSPEPATRSTRWFGKKKDEDNNDKCICNNNCRRHNDGLCDDGGPGKSWSRAFCDLGTDCADCGYSTRNERLAGAGCPYIGCAVRAAAPAHVQDDPAICQALATEDACRGAHECKWVSGNARLDWDIDPKYEGKLCEEQCGYAWSAHCVVNGQVVDVQDCADQSRKCIADCPPSANCTLEDGTQVPYKWQGNNTGTQSCNHCSCGTTCDCPDTDCDCAGILSCSDRTCHDDGTYTEHELNMFDGAGGNDPGADPYSPQNLPICDCSVKYCSNYDSGSAGPGRRLQGEGGGNDPGADPTSPQNNPDSCDCSLQRCINYTPMDTSGSIGPGRA